MAKTDSSLIVVEIKVSSQVNSQVNSQEVVMLEDSKVNRARHLEVLEDKEDKDSKPLVMPMATVVLVELHLVDRMAQVNVLVELVAASIKTLTLEGRQLHS